MCAWTVVPATKGCLLTQLPRHARSQPTPQHRGGSARAYPPCPRFRLCPTLRGQVGLRRLALLTVVDRRDLPLLARAVKGRFEEEYAADTSTGESAEPVSWTPGQGFPPRTGWGSARAKSQLQNLRGRKQIGRMGGAEQWWRSLLDLGSSERSPERRLKEMSNELEVGPVDELPPGTVKGIGPYAVGNAGGELFAVTRRCRHLLADLAGGTIDEDGCLTCPWHGAKYDVTTGRMRRGPQGIYAKIPGLGVALRAWTLVLPLGRGRVTERDATLYVE